jgi:mutator protein MutT
MSQHEVVDLVGNNGQIVHTAIARTEAETLNGPELHIPIIGCVVLNSAGKVLVHERAEGKRFAECLDHVYGAIASGESPEDAAMRELYEELGVTPLSVSRVREGINEYHYYQYLFVAVTNDEPRITSQREVAWAGYLTIKELETGRTEQTRLFTHNFFTDLEATLQYVESKQ